MNAMTLNLTLEELRGHGLVDEFGGAVHQSHGGVQVVIHYGHVQRRLTQSPCVERGEKTRRERGKEKERKRESEMRERGERY